MIRLALVVLLCFPLMALAQRGFPRGRPAESHVSITSSATGAEATELLARKLGEAELPDYVRQLMKGNGDFDSETAQKLLQSPFGANVLKRLADGDPTLMRLVEQFAAQRPELKGLSRDELRRLLSERAGSLLDARGAGSLPTISLPGLNAAPSNAQREMMARQAYTERINDALRELKLDGMLDQLRDSPAFKEWINALGKTGSADNPGPLTLGDTMHLFGGFDQWIKQLRPFLTGDLPTLRNLNISPPTAPTVRLPSFGFSSWSFASLTIGNEWPTLMLLIALVSMLTVALLRMRQLRMRPATASATLGPWPVDPNRVSTRQDVIAAFEYLAVARCGSDAAHWHHHDVAKDLGRDPSKRSDAESLASLYEQARYEPPERVGPWESARATLCRLAEGLA